MTTFNELQLSPEILKSLAGLGYDEATEVQAKVIPAILNQKDVLVQSKTEAGKRQLLGFHCVSRLSGKKISHKS